MIAILGLGEQAKAIINYILKQTDEHIVTIDLRNYYIDPKYNNRWIHFQTSRKLTQIFSLLSNEKEEKMTIINCLPTEYILEATKLAVSYGWNIIDLAGVTEIEREQMKLDSDARNTGSVVVRACGIAPGIVSSFVNFFVDQYEEMLVGIKVFCGGIPKYPEYPLGYVRVFNESGVMKEYSGLAQEIKDGIQINIPTLSRLEHIFVPSLGILEADITSGGISTTTDNLDIDYFSYSTLRYPGHFQYIKNNILNQPNPKEVLSGILPYVSAENPDIVILRFEVETTEEIEILDYFWEYDYQENLSAMSQATGYISAEVALQTNDMASGVYNMEVFDPFIIRNKVREMRTEGNFSKTPIRF